MSEITDPVVLAALKEAASLVDKIMSADACDKRSIKLNDVIEDAVFLGQMLDRLGVKDG